MFYLHKTYIFTLLRTLKCNEVFTYIYIVRYITVASKFIK